MIQYGFFKYLAVLAKMPGICRVMSFAAIDHRRSPEEKLTGGRMD